MSRAFTSEEYEAREEVFEIPAERKVSADSELVFSYSKGRDFGDPSLPYEIGMHFLNGDSGFFQSDEFAVKWLEKAVDMNSNEAMLALADFYLRDTKANGYRKPALLIRKAADNGSAEAAGRLDMSRIDSPTSRRTFNTYRFNAELGDVDAMVRLAEGFERGDFGKDKYKAAANWYMHAFRKGRKDAAKHVLALYYKKKIELSEEDLGKLRS